ncbi:mechanosensitive ion channel domain-containing protein [Vibrio cholerae]|uniref:mechanosensitive ion channel domain-containing protein n=1 Tax=Vibrio cholerae TaxID=666 RepID=UPI000893D75A|nr:mechanosensitive ion channel domain-containing protein [Vibrio cholerae]EHD2269041.1 mechanosensitive ion channel [Vibrio cholerae]EIJ2219709.1 mechanosensitive ion channel [Vibrio cholerae]EJL6996940.1 mechanosensitive ion channel [Vibrio cholerae]EKF9880860.1 mechanosensitive ion channel [Vibrio cholerae]OFI74876.1 mechanosensitive ion channel protein [Vibrio cholerae]
MEYLALLQTHYKWLMTILIIVLYPHISRITLRLFESMITGRVDIHRLKRARWLIRTLLFLVMLFTTLILWGIELRGLLVVGSSLFALLGVGLFAGWSLLSNVTAFLILFAQNQCRIGSWVRIVDGANFIEGKIIDMALLNVELETLEGNRVLYPNNLFIVRPVIVLQKAPEKAVKKPERKQLPKGL